MSEDSIELANFNVTDLPENCGKGFHYTTLEEATNSDVDRVSKTEQTKDDDNLTDLQGFMLLLPTYIGIGFLGFPYMVKILGLWVGSGGLLFYGFLNELGALVLTGSTQRLTERTGERFGDLGRVAEMSMKLGPPSLQPHAGKFRFSVNCCILLSYGLYIPDLISAMNLLAKDKGKETVSQEDTAISVINSLSVVREVLHQYLDISDAVSITAISLLLLPVFLTRRLKLLSRLATVGNIVLIGIIIISFQYICRDLPDSSTRSAAKPIDFISITSFTNDVLFSYDGIVMVLPTRYRMKSKTNFDGWNGVLGLALIIVICCHVGSGFFGYLKFGEMTQVNYILNLEEDNWMFISLKILSFLTLYCAIGTTVFLVVEIIWDQLKDRLRKESVQNCCEYICRVAVLVLSCSFTILVPEFQQLMSLTGCFGPCFVTLIVPFIIKLMIMYDEEEPTSAYGKVKRKMTLITCVCILIFGIYSLIAGVGVAVYTAVNHIVL